MARARGRPSLINLTNLGDKAIALRKSGMSLPEISQRILEEDNVKLTSNVLSRYLRKHDRDLFAEVDSVDSLKNIVSTFDAVDFYFDKLESTSAHERRAMINRLKSARYTILGDVKEIMSDHPLTDDRKDVNKYLIVLSDKLCPKCREVIAVAVMSIENINVFLSDYSKAKQSHLALGDWDLHKDSWEHTRDLIKEFHNK